MTTTTDVRTRVPTVRAAAAASVGGVLLLAVAGCGSSTPNDTAPGGAPGYAQGGTQGGPQGQQGGRFPGADGKVAAVDGSTAQVQGMQGQTAVTWTASTTFTKEVSATLADVKVGTCVLVASDAPSTSSTPATAVTAASVRITPRTGTSCAAGFRGPDGAGGPQVGGTPPSGAPSGGPNGARPQLRAVGGAAGEVTAVSGAGFTVASSTPGGSTTKVTVTVGDATTYTTTAKGAASDVRVGVCVQAMGAVDDTGAVTATTVAVSQPKDGQCGGLVRMQSGDGAPGKES